MSVRGWPLLAEKSIFQGLGDHFRLENAQLDSSDLFVVLGVVIVGGFIVWLMATYMRRAERPTTVDNPKRLFHELCQAHGLERHEASLLRSIAEALGLENPSLLFIDPGLLDGAILDSRWNEESPELVRFRELIFGEDVSPPETTEVAPAVI